MAGPGCLASDPVVVVGAGLTGGLIALALARLGLTVIQVSKYQLVDMFLLQPSSYY